MSDAALFLVRAVVGGFMPTHGLPKLRNSTDYIPSFESFGFRPAALLVAQAGTVEVTSGALIGLGMLGPIGPMLLLSDMIVAAASVMTREKAIDPAKHETEALYAACAILLAFSEPGRFSVDRLLRLKLFDAPWLRYLSLGAAITGAGFMLALRQKPEPSAETPSA
jgi:putative oxidoreductase